MKYNDDYYEEEHGSGSKVTYLYMILIMSVVILGVTALVFWVNRGNGNSDGSGYAAAVAQKEASEAEASKKANEANDLANSSSSKLTSDQLDIWTLPDTGRISNTSSGNASSSNTSSQSSSSEESSASVESEKTTTYDATEKESMTQSESESEEDEKEDEEVTSVTVKHSDGTKEVISLDDDIARSDYDYSNLTAKSPLMTYSEDGKVISKCGVMVSAADGDVDFSKLKNAGVDFVMIKIGQRGYSSGNIVLDANYEDNLAAAKKAGLGIGVYFVSQAITKNEAKEEADAVMDAIEKYTVKYPVAFVMENETDDMARIESIGVSERTQMAISFLDRVAAEGYEVAVYGDMEWLMTNVDMSKLTDYDVWYKKDGSQPDFPYEFTLWTYSSNSTVKGIDTKATMILSFKDYTK